MKQLFVILGVVFTIWFNSASFATAAIAEDVQKLIDTNECPVCILNEANLQNAELAHANLKIAVLSRANLAGADLQSANLMLSDLEAANLTAANLAQAQLNGASLPNANLWGRTYLVLK
ncbi:MAG: pentapeptide repeat-containing protein [Nodosilinea sp. LVE1205-7]|jgi:uncharacterized protein YjbI with pentapeptide repeats